MNKLLIISQTTAGKENDVCKTKACLVDYYHHLADKWDITIALPVSSHYDNFHTGLINAERIKIAAIPRKLIPQIRFFLKECRKAELVFVFMPTWRGVLCSLIAFITRKPLALYEGSFWSSYIPTLYRGQNRAKMLKGKLLSFLAYIIERVLFRIASCAFVTGKKMQECFNAYNRHIIVTKPIMQIMKTGERYTRHFSNKDDIHLLFVGNISFSKGLDYLFEAISSIQGVCNISLTCIGTGKDQDKLWDKAYQLHITDKISFPGYADSFEKLESYYKAADIFVLPSLSEGMPRVLYEAAMFALPIITTPVGGVPFFWENGNDSLFINVGDSCDTASKILSLVQDTKLQEKIGIAAQQKVYRLFSNPSWKQHSRILKTVLKNK